MSSELLPHWHSPPQPSHGRKFRRWGCFCFSNGVLATGIVFSTSILACLIFYMTFLSPHGPLLLTPSDWYGPPQLHPKSTVHVDPSEHLLTAIKHADEVPPLSPSPPPVSDVPTLEEIRDIVAPTRGFFSRDFSLHLGWNNVSIRATCEPN